MTMILSVCLVQFLLYVSVHSPGQGHQKHQFNSAMKLLAVSVFVSVHHKVIKVGIRRFMPR